MERPVAVERKRRRTAHADGIGREDQRLQILDLLRGDALGGKIGRRRLEGDAELEQLMHVVEADGRHEVATARHRFEEPVLLQQGQGLADRRLTGPEPPAQRVFHEDRSRAERQREDVLSERGVDPLLLGARGAGAASPVHWPVV